MNPSSHTVSYGSEGGTGAAAMQPLYPADIQPPGRNRASLCAPLFLTPASKRPLQIVIVHAPLKHACKFFRVGSVKIPST